MPPKNKNNNRLSAAAKRTSLLPLPSTHPQPPPAGGKSPLQAGATSNHQPVTGYALLQGAVGRSVNKLCLDDLFNEAPKRSKSSTFFAASKPDQHQQPHTNIFDHRLSTNIPHNNNTGGGGGGGVSRDPALQAQLAFNAVRSCAARLPTPPPPNISPLALTFLESGGAPPASATNPQQGENQSIATEQLLSSEDPLNDKEATAMKKRWLSCCKSVVAKQILHVAPAKDKHTVQTAQLTRDLNGLFAARQEAERTARMKALKENDAEAYLEHLNDAKLGSLLNIMEVTHNFMMKLGAKMEKQSSEDAAACGGGGNATAAAAKNLKVSKALQATDEYRRFKEYVASAKDEYKLVHKSAVFVEEQPKGLEATLMPHQLVGLRFLVSLQANNINGILADEMGVGKTIQTLAFILHLKEHKKLLGPHLVLAPLSIVREWREACETFTPNSLRVCEFHELDHPARDAKNYDVVLMAIHRTRTSAAAVQSVQWSFIVVDEGHKAVSNPETQTALAISAIPYKHRLVLTGTPLNSDIQELFALLNFINPRLFDERSTFDDVFRRPFANAGCANDKEVGLNEEEKTLLVMRMHQILRPFMLRRTKKDIDTNLKITFHDVRCPLTPLQTETLRLLRNEKRLPQMIDNKCELRSILTKEISAQGLCNHAFMIPFYSQLFQRGMSSNKDESSYGNDTDATTVAPPAFDSQPEEGPIALRCSGKFMVLDLILRRMRAVGRKVVIFSHWLDTIDLLTEYLDARGWGDGGYVVLTGATSPDERKECVRQFRANDHCGVFLVSMKAGGCGLNLQVASMIIMIDKDYTATNEDQAIARVFRIGQKNTVRALYLNTNDESEARISVIADRKNKPRQAIIEGGGYHVQAVTEEERREQLALHGTTAAAEVIDCCTGFEPPSSACIQDTTATSIPAPGGALPHHNQEDRRRHISTLFDHLIANDDAEVAKKLQELDSTLPVSAVVETDAAEAPTPPASGVHHHNTASSYLIEPMYQSMSELPFIITNGLDECRKAHEEGLKQSLEDCGRGKRSRNEELVYDEPSDAVLERLMDKHDVDEDEALEIFKKEELAKRRKRLEEAMDILGVSTTNNSNNGGANADSTTAAVIKAAVFDPHASSVADVSFGPPPPTANTTKQQHQQKKRRPAAVYKTTEVSLRKNNNRGTLEQCFLGISVARPPGHGAHDGDDEDSSDSDDDDKISNISAISSGCRSPHNHNQQEINSPTSSFNNRNGQTTSSDAAAGNSTILSAAGAGAMSPHDDLTAKRCPCVSCDDKEVCVPADVEC